ncbi:formate dehydrogenase accessory sulfurtransferase FdhD [Tenacibaculum finnmarkense]|uniref:formate dehydrogenase accessory sulfurtransferase FdhD n=1 Tax=Tenacibaculum finnmarkense TaxID=2781243 RepID=UPI001E3CC43D|nr:formate dehydrogenase accessory sulfurtransferase FdhD [Tenacibaculum finnmarkense]MCD8400700.1 formate dehydrogenase accessory sulfurtransferase FdhD [Tenacibaculum finnmarkense genomovar ulcerans]MCG8763131.1 formate dehydrogenase accessory sulfurtransferase FdhD [Tenacibaculum finnmarkense]MCG8785797.1 formate dehydrogenase accessory sulfurtransferase FdhD [Tenacibaculum finnmarkense]MCG8788508.1 formate dehydrogenase accessory sulfurtransferase FdhD [Tenacibaculum finnmarkense]MCG879596
MKKSSVYESIKLSKNNALKVADTIVVEAALQININNESYTVVMRTPGDDNQLIRGLLYAEDIYKSKEALSINTIEVNTDESTILNVTIPKDKLRKGYLNKRTLLSVSSCGICGKTALKDLKITGESLSSSNKANEVAKEDHKSAVNTAINSTFDMFIKMTDLQFLFKETGGSHACALFNKKKELLTIKEDIGRHNAVDKCIGDLIEKQQLKQVSYMLVSGRVSYEIVSKAFFAKIRIIIAVSACSSLAVDFAKEFGICLIGFSRNDKMTVYANPQHILNI